jgi:hypothetical protein
VWLGEWAVDKRELDRILATKVYFWKRAARQTIAEPITNDSIRSRIEL